MKKLLMMLMVLLGLSLSIGGCQEIGEGMEDAGDEIKDATN
jgi:hypothetical protein